MEIKRNRQSPGSEISGWRTGGRSVIKFRFGFLVRDLRNGLEFGRRSPGCKRGDAEKIISNALFVILNWFRIPKMRILGIRYPFDEFQMKRGFVEVHFQYK